jgi:hypothetical protein
MKIFKENLLPHSGQFVHARKLINVKIINLQNKKLKLSMQSARECSGNEFCKHIMY